MRESNRIREVAATVDALTGLLNRQGFIEKMARILLSKQTEGLTGRLLYFDIDRLKEINQRFGYPAGDRAIQASAALLRGIFPPDALIGRFCGDEFAVLLHEADNSRVEDYRKRVESGALSFSSDSGLTLRMYVGYSDVKFGEDMDAETVIRKADADLYDHKRQAGEESDR